MRGERDIDEVFGLPQDRPRPFGDLDADPGRGDRAARPVEQGDAERPLELLDRRAQRRLADEAGLRGLSEVPAIGEGDQEFELA